MDDILMGIPRLLCLRCCCYFKGDGVTFFGMGSDTVACPLLADALVGILAIALNQGRD